MEPSPLIDNSMDTCHPYSTFLGGRGTLRIGKCKREVLPSIVVSEQSLSIPSDFNAAHTVSNTEVTQEQTNTGPSIGDCLLHVKEHHITIPRMVVLNPSSLPTCLHPEAPSQTMNY